MNVQTFFLTKIMCAKNLNLERKNGLAKEDWTLFGLFWRILVRKIGEKGHQNSQFCAQNRLFEERK